MFNNLKAQANKFFYKEVLEDTPVKDHTHNWELISKTYAPAVKEAGQITSLPGASVISPLTLEKILFGTTTLLSKCSCGQMNKQELIGSDESTLEEFLEKAEAYGPQYIPVGNETFVLMKVPPVSTGALPVR